MKPKLKPGANFGLVANDIGGAQKSRSIYGDSFVASKFSSESLTIEELHKKHKTNNQN